MRAALLASVLALVTLAAAPPPPGAQEPVAPATAPAPEAAREPAADATSEPVPGQPPAAEPEGPTEPAPRVAVPSTREASDVPRPRDLRDVSAWLRWKDAQQIDVLPQEARLFYRRGILARQSGQNSDALDLVRGAVQLDPTFLAPHLTLAGWALPGDPAQSLVHCAAIVDLWRHDFNVQLDAVANMLVLGLEAVFAGLLFAGLFIVVHRRHELAHGLHEELALVVSSRTARWWGLVIVALPFLAGLGLTLPVLGLLAFLWPLLRARERVLSVLLAAAAAGSPFALSALDRFALALTAEGPPLHGLPALESCGWDPARQARLAAEVARHPGDGFARFALAWHSRRGGKLELAEASYRAALTAWPEHDAVLTNLGNVAAMRGRADEALELYARASRRNPHNAAAHFNAAQLHTRRFEYTAANEELRQASAIDFELVQRFQSRAGASGMLPLVEVWPGPATFWRALAAARPPAGRRTLPLMLRGRLEASGLPFTFAALLAFGLGLGLGRWQHHRLPMRACSNCGVIVCRRCAKRRREAALCQECERIGAGAETQDFSRVLLVQHRARRLEAARIRRTALAAVVPGYGLLAHHRVFGPTLLLACTWLFARLALGLAPPFSMTPRLSLPGGELPPVLPLVGLVVTYAWSLVGYFIIVSIERAREAQLAAATRGRITQSTRRQPSLAA